MKKILKWVAIVLGGLTVLMLLVGVALYPSGVEKLTRSYPNIAVSKVEIPANPGAIVKGKQIAISTKCTECHGEDLSGRLLTNDPVLGTIPASNLTSGNGGIARSYTDSDWIRAIRYGVKPDGKVINFMFDYSKMNDHDLGDLIAYLKQISPVDEVYPDMHFGLVTPIVPALGFFPPAAERFDQRSP